MATKTEELLERVMAGGQLTPRDIDELVSSRTAEDQFLDYKHGDELAKKKDAARTVREYVTAFANSSGGLLLVGIDAPEDKAAPWKVTGAVAPGNHDLARWASNCLTGEVGQFSPPPRIQVVNHPAGSVLAVSALRAPNLIPLVRAGQLAYFFRLGDQTIEAPSFLIGDLLLGRRQQPRFDLSCQSVHLRSAKDPNSPTGLAFHVSFDVAARNVGLQWAEELRLGIVAWCLEPRSAAPPELLAEIDAGQRPMERLAVGFKLARIGAEAHTPPYEVARASDTLRVQIPDPRHGSFLWRAAFVLLARGALPMWFDFECPLGHAHLLESKKTLATAARVTRVAVRPRIDWST